MNTIDPKKLNFQKLGGLLPAVIQDGRNMAVLMVGFMDEAALSQTITTGKVTFWSRTKQRLWQKGETSGNSLNVQSIVTDCDSDSLLIRVIPMGPACHTGAAACFGAEPIGE